MRLLVAFCAVYAVLVVLSAVAAITLKGFLSRTNSISSSADLKSFKRLARLQMYMAILGVGLLFPATMTAFYGLFARQLDLGLVFGINAIVFVLSIPIKNLERQARSLPVEPSLADEYAAIGKAWVKKVLPDF